MNDAPFHAVEDSVHDLRPGDDRTDRHESAGERLGDTDDVRLDLRPVLKGEPFARPTQARLHFVEDQERAVLSTQTLRLCEISVGDDLTGFSLDRFDNECSRLFKRKRLFQRRKIVERNLLRAGEKGPETLAEKVGAVQRQRAGRQSMKPVIAIDNVASTGVAASELDRAFDRLGSTIAEEDARQIAAGFLGEFLGDEPAQHAAFHTDEVGGVALKQLLEDRFHFRVISPQRKDTPTGEQIEIFLPCLIPQPAPFAADVFLVEADGLEHFHERGVEMLGMQVIRAIAMLIDISEKVCVN